MTFDTSHRWDSRGLLHCPIARQAKAAKAKANGTFRCPLCNRTLKLDPPVTARRAVEVKS